MRRELRVTASQAFVFASTQPTFSADLIAIGSEEVPRLQNALLGSVSLDVVTQATCDVLLAAPVAYELCARGALDRLLGPPTEFRIFLQWDGSCGHTFKYEFASRSSVIRLRAYNRADRKLRTAIPHAAGRPAFGRLAFGVADVWLRHETE